MKVPLCGLRRFFAGTVLDSSELLNMPVVGDRADSQGFDHS